MIIARHGGSSHYVRPDVTYRTGVIPSIVGFQPQQDVMAVAQMFTQGPYAFQQGSAGTMIASGVSGLRGAGVAGPQIKLFGPPIQFLGISSLGWFQRIYLKVKSWAANRKATKVLNASGIHGAFRYGRASVASRAMLSGIVPYGPRAWAANQVMPSVNDRVQMLVAMQQKNQPREIAQNNAAVIMQRWNNRR
jgi:hypothetical protein